MSAIIVSAFPGMGKSYAYNLLKNDIKVLDSDSSKFDKDNFPWNYIEHIKDNIDNNDIIFVSSHKEVRDALNDEGIDFDLFYPAKERRNEFLQNYVSRHSPRNLIMKIDNNWNKWIDEIETGDNPHCHLHCLREQGQFIGNNSMIMQFVAQVKKETSETKEVENYDIDFTEEDLSLLVKLKDDLWNVATNKDDNTDKLTLKFKKFEIPTEEFYILSKTIRFIKGKDNGKFSKK